MIETKFKQTEIGLIPEEWEVMNLGDISTKTSYGIGAPAVDYDGVNKYIRITDIDDNTRKFVPSPLSSPEFFSSDYIVREGDLLVARTGASVGKTYIYNADDGCLIYAGFLIKLHISDAVPMLVFYNTLTKNYNQYISSQSARTGQPGINLQQLLQFSFPIPSDIQEQQRIATALSDIDALISALNKKIEKKKLIKQGAMQQLLTGQKRLQGFSEPLVEKRLGEMCSIYRGGSPRPIENFITNDVNGINWIKIGDVEPNSKYIIKTAEKIKLEGESKSRKVFAGDFILSNSMSFGRPYILKIDGCIHDGWLVIQNYQEYFDLDYLYYLLGSEYVFEQYKKMAAGSSVQNLNKDKVSNVLVRMPLNKTEQTAIAEILSDMDNEIVELESKRTKYDSIKQGMMQQLLTGKIRLID